MISVVSLASVAAAAAPKQTIQTSVPVLCNKLSIDPALSGIDAVILGPEDIKGSNLAMLNQAIANKHDGVCIIWIYANEKDANKIDTEYKYHTKKVKESDIRKVIDEFIGDHIRKTGQTHVSSSDFEDLNQEVLEEESTGDTQEIVIEEEDEDEGIELVPSDTAELPKVEEYVEPPKIEVPKIDNTRYTEAKVENLEVNSGGNYSHPIEHLKKDTLEAKIEKVSNIRDWEMYKDMLHHDTITKHLIEENTEYVGLMNILDVLDEKIKTVWRDKTLNSTERFNKIKDIGLDRANHRASINSKNVDKVISIISAITSAASRTVEEKLDAIDTSLYKITTDKEALLDTSAIDTTIQKRADTQLELLEICRSVVDLYKAMDNLVDEEIAELDAGLPSSNEFINHMVKPVGVKIFTPSNTAMLVTRLLQGIQAQRIAVSQLETKIRDFIEVMFKLCNDDEDIIRAYSEKTEQLKANRVEDIVIVDSVLKNCLHLFIGARGSGIHATTIIRSGMQSRSDNVLVLDLTQHNKFASYGLKSVPLSEFMNQRIEQEMLCVHADKVLSPVDLQNVVVELKSRLNFYKYINIILDESDRAALEQLSADAYVVHYITNCTSDSIAKMTDIYKYPIVNNIARKIILIGAPISPLTICDKIGIDTSSTQLITLPNIPQVLACELSEDRPYDYEEVKIAFKEAFR